MIEDWREAFDCGEFPFYFVQIAPYNYGGNKNSAFLREAQLSSLSLPETGMAVTMDVGNPKNIHPVNKVPVANRLANMALRRVYGKGADVDSGPIYQSARKSGVKMVLRFAETGGKLRLSDPTGDVFQIAGADKKFVNATAVVVGDELHVHSASVKSPVAVRYGWTNAPKAALFNRKRLPASSFRTDSWKQ
jgi:sialate O-acetylesterase